MYKSVGLYKYRPYDGENFLLTLNANKPELKGVAVRTRLANLPAELQSEYQDRSDHGLLWLTSQQDGMELTTTQAARIAAEMEIPYDSLLEMAKRDCKQSVANTLKN